MTWRLAEGATGLAGRGNGAGGRGNGAGPIVVSRAVEVGGRQVGIAELRFRGSLTRAQSVLRDRLFGAVLLGSAIAVAIALLGAALVTRAIAVPLRRLAAAARRLQAGDLAARAGAQGAPGELGQLSRAFDGMADTLDSEREARRRLVSDLAHEVRTPIAILQGNLEELVDEIAQATPQRLASLHEEVLRLGALVEDLDALAHADAPVAVIDREPVELEALARAQVEALRPRLDAKALTLEQQFSPVTVLGDRARLGQVLANLLSNAMKFTPEGGQIKVLVDTADGAARISVADSGPGIPADEQGRVLERFWRGKRSTRNLRAWDRARRSGRHHPRARRPNRSRKSRRRRRTVRGDPPGGLRPLRNPTQPDLSQRSRHREPRLTLSDHSRVVATGAPREDHRCGRPQRQDRPELTATGKRTAAAPLWLGAATQGRGP